MISVLPFSRSFKTFQFFSTVSCNDNKWKDLWIFLLFRFIWATPCENVSSGVSGQRRPRSTCTSVQSDQGLQCLLIESLDTTECMKVEKRLEWYFAHAQMIWTCPLCACSKAFICLIQPIYSWLSLSRPCLSRITAYLKVKILSLLKHGNLTTGKKILWKRGEIAPKEQFLLFSTIFSIYL